MQQGQPWSLQLQNVKRCHHAISAVGAAGQHSAQGSGRHSRAGRLATNAPTVRCNSMVSPTS